MKSIELKTLEIEVFGEKQEFSYKEMIKLIMETPSNPQAGTDIGEIRKSIRVLDAIEKADDILELEDSDFSYARQRVLGAKFNSNHRAFSDFVGCFEEIT
jgi:hypothetical protein